MAAYGVFLEKLMPVAEKIEKILEIPTDEAADWVRDQFLDLAVSHLATLKNPDAWSAFITASVIHRAYSLRRTPRLRLVDKPDLVSAAAASDAGPVSDEGWPESLLSTAEPDGNETDGIEPDDSAADLFDRISFRDRALLKLHFGISPVAVEWVALSAATGKTIARLQAAFETFLTDADVTSTEIENRIAELYGKVLALQAERRRLAMRLDALCLENPADEEAITEVATRLQERTASLNRQYRRYHELQKGRIHRIPARTIAGITGISEDDIHQIVSRARRKIRRNRV